MDHEEERVLILEQKVEVIAVEQKRLRQIVSQQDEKWDTMREDIHFIRNRLARFDGMWAGFALAFALLGGSIAALASVIWQKLTG